MQTQKEGPINLHFVDTKCWGKLIYCGHKVKMYTQSESKKSYIVDTKLKCVHKVKKYILWTQSKWACILWTQSCDIVVHIVDTKLKCVHKNA